MKETLRLWLIKNAKRYPNQTLAKRLGMSPQALSNLKKRGLSYEKAAYIAKTLGWDLPDLS